MLTYEFLGTALVFEAFASRTLLEAGVGEHREPVFTATLRCERSVVSMGRGGGWVGMTENNGTEQTSMMGSWGRRHWCDDKTRVASRPFLDHQGDPILDAEGMPFTGGVNVHRNGVWEAVLSRSPLFGPATLNYSSDVGYSNVPPYPSAPLECVWHFAAGEGPSQDHDWLFGEEGDDAIGAGNGNDTLFGGPGNDLLMGEAGNDVIYPGPGLDVIDGGFGDDVVHIRHPCEYHVAKSMIGGPGINTLILPGTLNEALAAGLLIAGFNTIIENDVSKACESECAP